MAGCFGFLTTWLPSWGRLEDEEDSGVADDPPKEIEAQSTRISTLEAQNEHYREIIGRMGEQIANLEAIIANLTNRQQLLSDRLDRNDSRVLTLRNHQTATDRDFENHVRHCRIGDTTNYSRNHNNSNNNNTSTCSMEVPGDRDDSSCTQESRVRPFQMPGDYPLRHNTTTLRAEMPINFSSLESSTTYQRTIRPGKFFIFKHVNSASAADNLLPMLDVLKKSWKRLGYKIEEYNNLEPLEIMETMHSSTLGSHEDEQHCFIILSPADQTRYLPIMQLCTLDPSQGAMFYIQNSGGENRPDIPDASSTIRRPTVFQMHRQEIDEVDSDESDYARSITPEFPTVDLSTINSQLMGRPGSQRD